MWPGRWARHRATMARRFPFEDAFSGVFVKRAELLREGGQLRSYRFQRPGFPASRAEVDSEVSGLTLIPDVEPACTPFEEAPAACLRSLESADPGKRGSRCASKDVNR